LLLQDASTLRLVPFQHLEESNHDYLDLGFLFRGNSGLYLAWYSVKWRVANDWRNSGNPETDPRMHDVVSKRADSEHRYMELAILLRAYRKELE